MSLTEFIAFAAGATAVWLLMAHTARSESRYRSERGTICEQCSEGVVHDGGKVCRNCRRANRAKELKEQSK